jgi:4-aminobutyrate aminotransferase
MTERSRLAPVWSKLTDLEVVSGRGAYVYTRDGEEYLDLTSGIAVTSTGHSHPKVVEAIAQQAQRFIHAQVNIYTHDLLEPLAQRLYDLTPKTIESFFFSNSGAEATEGAIKLARQYTKRPNVIVFQGSFHGRTSQAMAMTTSRTGYRAGHMPLPAGVFVAVTPGYLEGEAVSDDDPRVERALAYLDYLLLAQSAPSETAAFIVEPVLGEGGYLPMPKRFLEGVAERAKEHGILFIVDEVQTGFGRTGKMFAVEHYRLEPDVLVMAKGLGSGFPISAIGARQEIMDRWPVGSHGGTYGGNPMGCAAALATIEVLTEPGFMENVNARARQLREGLESIAEQEESIGDVRGLGLMIGVTLLNPSTSKPDADRVAKIIAHAKKESKVLIMNAGTWGNVIRWMPPLIVDEGQIERGLDAFALALKNT